MYCERQRAKRYLVDDLEVKYTDPNVVEQIEYIPKKVIIEKLTLDVFGFSRGAAAARTFIHDTLFGSKFVMAGMARSKSDESTALKAALEKKGYTVSALNVCFAGLFDTVSTYGIGVVTETLSSVGGGKTTGRADVSGNPMAFFPSHAR